MRWIDSLNAAIGKTLSWLNLVMVLTTLIIVVLASFFQLGWIWMQDIVLYCHGILFLLGSAYTLKVNKHVRVDALYCKMSKSGKQNVNILGVFFLLFPTIGFIGYKSYFYVVDSWSVFEGSKDGGGLEAVFLLKTCILGFCLLLFLQGISILMKKGASDE